MPAMAAKYGYMNCEGCASDGRTTRVLVRRNDKGGLSAKCDECDVTDYAPVGTSKLARWERKVEKLDAAPAAPKPAPKPAAEPAPKPAAEKKKYGNYV